MDSGVYKSLLRSSFSNVSYPKYQSSTSDYSSLHSGVMSERFYGDDSMSDIQTANQSPYSSSIGLDKPDVQNEVEQLRQELHSTIAMYNQACEDLILTQKKIQMLSSECFDEEQRLSAAKKREENLTKIAEEVKKKHLEAEKEIEMAKQLIAKEAYERQIAELRALRESLEKKRIVDVLFTKDSRYRMYTKEEIEVATDFFSETKLVGEGAYGKVYKCDLYHTPVAIKVLRAEASGKKEEFLQEVEILSKLRHPHILLLLGACPDNGCLVYEYMENGNLEDHIFRKNNKRPLLWLDRFRIIFEVACGLAFLHNSKPQPIVHRDLKPGNILIDRNYVSKIGDVGLAKIISDAVPDNITEYSESIIAGTHGYMDPEYQRTGTLRPKSDLYAFGVITLQLLTARHPNGIILKVENAINNKAFSDILDKSVDYWPLTEAEELGRMAIKCCQLRCRDRPDLETEVLPVLKRIAEFANAHVRTIRSHVHAPSHFYCPILQEVMVDPHISADGFTYEHSAIKAWLDRQDVSPVTKLRLPHKTLTPNHTLRIAIQEYVLSPTTSSA